MNSPVEDDQLFARYWRTFLPVWLIPVPILAAVLFADFFSSPMAVRVLSYFVGAIIIYAIGAQIPPLGLWRRGEITYSQMFTLTMPMGFVLIACALIGYFIHAHFAVESDSSNQTMKPTTHFVRVSISSRSNHVQRSSCLSPGGGLSWSR